jgi:hypothetical protein
VLNPCPYNLAALLRECGQSESDVVPMAQAVHQFTVDGVKKIGEGTYGEAYKVGRCRLTPPGCGIIGYPVHTWGAAG